MLRLWFSLLLTFILTGCSSMWQPSSNPNEEIETVPSPEVFAENLRTSTPLQVLATEKPSIQPTTTSTPTPTQITIMPTEAPLAPWLKTDCIELSTVLPIEHSSQGYALFNVYAEGRRTGVLSMDLTKFTGNQIEPENEDFIGIAISPDRKMMAYEHVVRDQSGKTILQDELVVINGKGELIKTIPWGTGWGSIPGWLDNQRLIINIGDLDSKDATGWNADTLLALNPFTGQEQILMANYPLIYNWNTVPVWGGWDLTVYDPSLTRVAYLKWADSEGGSYGIALWDMQEGKELSFLPVIYYPIPRWAPDGSKFITMGLAEVPGNLDLFLIDQTGVMDQLTHNSELNLNLEFVDYSWSPDGKQVALWLRDTLQSMRLAMLDVEKKELTDLCITGHVGANWPSIIQPPLWSPDSKQLIVMKTQNDNYSQNEIFLVDIVDHWAVQIAEDLIPVGWMVNKP